MNIQAVCPKCFKAEIVNDKCPNCSYTYAKDLTDRCRLPLKSYLNNRYIMGSTIGVGGFGRTYIAYDNVNFNKVAIKEFFPASLATRDNRTLEIYPQSQSDVANLQMSLKKFRDEANNLIKLKHNNVVQFKDRFDAYNTSYIVMDFIIGGTLAELMQRKDGKLPMDLIRNLFLDILSGVEACHFQGIIHRDIKPENILIDRQGTPKLLDFGASKDVIRDGINSSFAVISEGFSPPEQYTANKLPAPTNDIYSLGATMYYCLTNIRPQSAAEYQNKPIYWPNDRTYVTNDGIDLRKIVTKAMAYDVNKRYQSINQMRDDFRIKQNIGETIPNIPTIPPIGNQLAPKSASKGLITAGYIFAILGGYIGLAIGYTLFLGKNKEENGKKIHVYDSNSRKHGKIIFIIGIIMAVIGITIKSL